MCALTLPVTKEKVFSKDVVLFLERGGITQLSPASVLTVCGSINVMGRFNIVVI